MIGVRQYKAGGVAFSVATPTGLEEELLNQRRALLVLVDQVLEVADPGADATAS